VKRPQRAQSRTVVALVAVLLFPLTAAQAAGQAALAEESITIERSAELTAVVAAGCDKCAWDIPGREAVTLRVTLDGQYSQHLPLVRSGSAEYAIALGEVSTGRHLVRLDVDRAATATDLRGDGVVTAGVTLKANPSTIAIAYAPFLYARPNTLGKFTDPPVFMWYETERTAGSTWYRYSAIFTNEDGGTQTDRLMATWGRTTDIEYVYGVEIDQRGAVVAEEFQGPDHKLTAFKGRRAGRHPLLWVATDNNMVADSGETTIRYAPLAIPFDLTNQSREVVMDSNPWLYAVAGKEMVREGKIVADARPGTNTIPDPRRFVYLEACAEVGTAAVGFAVRVGESWLSSDFGLATHRIARDGCFRGAVPLPTGVDAREVTAVRVSAFQRPARNGQPAPAATPVRLTRINTAFVLSAEYVPTSLLAPWQGLETIGPGKHFVLPINKPRPLN
jgi:hypothetical protein